MTWVDRLFIWVLFLGAVVAGVFTASYANDTRDAALLLVQRQPSVPEPVYQEVAVAPVPEPQIVEVVTERIVPVMMLPLAIATQGVNMRDVPGNDGAVIGWLEPDDQVTVTEISDGWWLVERNGETGWVFSRYLTLVAIAEPA